MNQVQDAIGRACAAQETAYRSRRALHTLVNTWDVDPNDARFAIFQEWVTTAIGAIQLRNTIGTAHADAALAPFGQRLADLLTDTQSAAGPCAEPNVHASVRKAADAYYPASAQNTHTTGTIRVVVTLDPAGFVRKATLYTMHVQGSSSDVLTQMAVLTAGSTTYHPEILSCKPVNGAKYVFVVQFQK